MIKESIYNFLENILDSGIDYKKIEKITIICDEKIIQSLIKEIDSNKYRKHNSNGILRFVHNFGEIDFIPKEREKDGN